MFTHQPLVPILNDAIEQRGSFPRNEDDMTAFIRSVYEDMNADHVEIAALIGLQRVLNISTWRNRRSGQITYDASTDARVIAQTQYAQSWVTLPTTGERIRFADLTVEQHQERIAYCRSLIHGYEDAIDRHAKAIEMIQASGVATLAQCSLPATKSRGRASKDRVAV